MENKGTITGKIVGILPISEKVTLVRIVSKTISERSGKLVTDAPSITFYKTHVPDIDSFKVGDHVIVSVHLSTRRIVKANGEKRFFYDIVGDSIKTYASVGDVNVIKLEAPVTHIFRPEGASVVFCTLRTRLGRFSSFPSVCCYGSIADVMENEIKVGDIVQMKCTVQTIRKERTDGKLVTRQSIICQSIAKADEE